jgi:hypothetical protein
VCISLLIRTATVAAHPAEGSSVAFVSTRPIRSGVKRIRHKGERHAHPLQAQSSSAHLAGSAGAESKQQQGPDVRVCGECMGCSASWLPDRLANAEQFCFSAQRRSHGTGRGFFQFATRGFPAVAAPGPRARIHSCWAQSSNSSASRVDMLCTGHSILSIRYITADLAVEAARTSRP